MSDVNYVLEYKICSYHEKLVCNIPATVGATVGATVVVGGGAGVVTKNIK